MPTATYSLAEVARHNRPSDLWLVIDGDVYDLTDFAEMHPGPSLMHAPPPPPSSHRRPSAMCPYPAPRPARSLCVSREKQKWGAGASRVLAR